MNRTYKLITLVILSLFVTSYAFGQIQRGDATARRTGVHKGNQIRTIFGNWGVIAQPGDQGPRAAWKYDTNGYVGDVSPLVGVRLPIKDYNNDGRTDTIYSVIITPVSRPGGGDYAPGGGTSWTFEPIPGFFNPAINQPGKGIAMNVFPETWPAVWPDHPTWVDSNGIAEWNGYFGRGQESADEESYFMMDDNKDEKMFVRYGFLPDPNDPSRKGQAIRMGVRGMQWSQFLAQDVMFWLYEIQNVGATTYEQTVFGTIVGTFVGADGDEWNDDVSFFQVRDAITYSWDFDKYIRPSANPRWQPNPNQVGYIAYAFLESPGNSVDGIDNDGDARNFPTSAPYFVENDFQPRTLKAGDKLVLIDVNKNYERTIFNMPNSVANVTSMGRSFRLVPDSTVLAEGNLVTGSAGFVLNRNAYDGIDNDLDGLIDENYQIHYRQYKADSRGTILIDTLNPVQYKDFAKGLGVTDDMIDESRADLKDNDRDWNHEIDDLGADGKPNTKDFGEGDGVPTPGEPNFDRTDVNESDQIGLTNFQYFVPAGDITMSNEDDMWRRLRPGSFDVPSSIVNNVAIRGEDGDFVYGSGYFPLLPGATERFSLALAFGNDLRGVIKTKRTAQLIYDANYNFPQPPDKPNVTAVPGDGKVTLYWDDVAEKTIDRLTKIKDFEGYLIYKGTDPDFIDSYKIADGEGNPKRYKPVAQFDLKNGIAGYFPSTPEVIEATLGVPFYLGDDNGIKNFWVDNDVVNGRTYYYAVVAYDRGDASRDIFPAETPKRISKDVTGAIVRDVNTVAVVPNAPAIGYVAPESGKELTRISGGSEVKPTYEVMNPYDIRDAQYEVTFVDSLVKGSPIAYAYQVTNKVTGRTMFNTPQPIKAINGAVFEGLNLSIDPSYQTLDSIKINQATTGWNSKKPIKTLNYSVAPFSVSGFPAGVKDARDYTFVFYNKFDKSSTDKLLGLPLAAKRGNFEIFDVTEKSNPRLVPFAWITSDTTLSKGDRIFLSDYQSKRLTWAVSFTGDSTKTLGAGDTLKINFLKPITKEDKFTFTSVAATYNAEEAKNNLDKIKAVPNPYIVTNVYESPLPPQIRGRGERVINFINLPPNSKISIFTSSGSLVKTLEHDGSLLNGTVSWDVRTKEGLDVAYGVYFYLVETPEGGKKTGKLAIIK